jgi:proline iminopeptidase
MFAAINGIRLFFDIDGKQFTAQGAAIRRKPVCFVLHGGPGDDHTSYLPALDSLTDHVQLVYIDFRGSGRSDYPDEKTYTLKQNVEDLEALRRYLGLGKILLFGQSYGGIAAQAYGIAYPENLEGLILLTTAADHRAFDRAKEELRKRGTAEQITMAEKYLWTGEFPDNETFLAYFKLFANMYTHKPVIAEEFSKIASRAILSYRALNMGFGGDLKTFDFKPDLPKIRCPVLLLGGRFDWVTPVECTLEIAKLLPDCETVILEESSHSVLSDQYEETLGAINGFLARRFPGELV